jgi:hypothetical protein
VHVFVDQARGVLGKAGDQDNQQQQREEHDKVELSRAAQGGQAVVDS